MLMTSITGNERRVTIDSATRRPSTPKIEHGVRAAIAAGRLRRRSTPDRPPARGRLRVNANTVARVYAHLERDGVLETRRGVGSFISATPAPRAAAGPSISAGSRPS